MPTFADLGDMYPDADGLCDTLFVNAIKLQRANRRSAAATAMGNASHTSVGARDASTLRDLVSLADMPDARFFSVVAHHPALSRVLLAVLDDIAGSRAMRLQTKQFDAFTRILLRICGDVEGLSDGTHPHPEKLATRLAKLLPSEALPALALTLMRTGPARGSLAITALLMQSPSIVAHMKSIGTAWCDSVHQIASSCADEGRKGRFQRKATDTLGLCERAHRHAKQLWALLHACPFVTDYLAPLPRLIASLRVLTDTIAPLLQHFVMTSDTLASRRSPLVRALAATANAATDSAVVALIFAGSFSNGRRVDCRMISTSVDEKTADLINSYGPFVTRRLLAAEPSIARLIHKLVGGTTANSGDSTGESLLAASLCELEQRSGSGGTPSVHLFAERVLLGLKKQDVLIVEEDLHAAVQTSVNKRRAKANANAEVNAPATTADTVVAPSSSHQQQQQQAAPELPPLGPEEAMVLDVMPHFNPSVVGEALAFYDGSVERFLDAAMMSNLPPHLEAKLTSAPSAVPVAHGASTSAGIGAPGADAAADKKKGGQQDDDDADDIPEEAYDALAGKASVFDLLAANFARTVQSSSGGAGEDDDDDFEAGQDVTAADRTVGGRADGSAAVPEGMEVLDEQGSSEFFAIDDSLKAAITAMAAAGDIYDDERDDADEATQHDHRGGRGAGNVVYDLDQDGNINAAPKRGGGGFGAPVSGGASGHGRHADPNVASSKAKPAYASKPKTLSGKKQHQQPDEHPQQPSPGAAAAPAGGAGRGGGGSGKRGGGSGGRGGGRIRRDRTGIHAGDGGD